MNEFVKNISDAFLGKFCTVLTGGTAVPLKDAMAHSQFFFGEAVKIDSFGIWLKHPKAETLAFFSFPIQGIVEEQYIPSTDPRHDKIKEEIAKNNAPKQSSQFINVDEISEKIRNAKKST